MENSPVQRSPLLRRREVILPIAGAGALLLLDSYLLLPGIGLLLAFLMVCASMLSLLYKLIRKRSRKAKALFKICIYSLAITGIYFSYSIHKSNAKHNAAPVITAVERYHEQHGLYPNHVRELIPEYLEVMPRPTWRHGPGSYHLLVSNDRTRAELWWPTHVRVSLNYHFETKHWTTQAWE